MPAPQSKAATSLRQELWTELKRLVQIRRVDGNEAVLLPPGPGLFPARKSALAAAVGATGTADRRIRPAFQADLHAAQDMLTRYFNTRDAGVVAAIKEIKRLSGLQIVATLPSIEASLAALDAYKGNQ